LAYFWKNTLKTTFAFSLTYFMRASLPSFDFIAPVYDVLAGLVFRDAQKKAQCRFLSEIPAGATVLILGGGTGCILPELFLKSNPSQVLYLEASRAMLEKARQRMQGLPQARLVEFRLGTEQDLLPQETFSVIITPFVLDLFTTQEVTTMVQRLSQALAPQGIWLHTDFFLSSRPAQRLWQKPLLWGMYRFFGLVSGISGKTLPPMHQIFRQAGFTSSRQALFFHGFIKAQVWQKSQNHG
jgi:tRNA (cmo5U34)-methyltransferase